MTLKVVRFRLQRALLEPFLKSQSKGFSVNLMKHKANGVNSGQIQAPTSPPKILTVAPISMFTDGQVQAGLHTMNMMAVAPPAASPVAAVSQIGDGQVQAPAHQASQINDGQIQAPATTTIMPVTESKDGQPVAPTVPAVSQKTDGQPIALTSAPPAISTVAKASTGGSPASVTSSAPTASSSGSNTSMMSCKSGPSFTLKDTKITDQKGRTGYIASNFQFQFDNPPQAGALFTTGFSICANGTLALGGTNIFYQCLSGNFYNLYDRSWAAQCSPAYIQTMQQVNC